MSKNRIQVLQWREYGDDEDCLSILAFAGDDDRDLRDIEAEAHELVITDENDDCPDGQGMFMVTEGVTIVDGEIFENNGRRFRILIEEIDEQGEALGGMCNVHWDVRCSPEGTCPKCQENEDAAANRDNPGMMTKELFDFLVNPQEGSDAE